MRHIPKPIFVAILVVMTVLNSVGSALLTAPVAKADTFGAPLSTGFFDQQSHTNMGFMFEDGFPNATYQDGTANLTLNVFLSESWRRLTSAADVEYENVRVAAIILTMMGVRSQDPRLDGGPYAGPDNRYNAGPYNSGGSFNSLRWKNGVGLAISMFNQWSSIVTAYANGSIPGASVNFNESVSVPNGTIDGFGTWVENAPPVTEYPDMSFTDINQTTDVMIVFHHPGGTRYEINRICGNLTGDETAFPPNLVTGYNVDLNLSATPTVRPGGTATVTTLLQNSTPTQASQIGTMEAYLSDPSRMAVPCAGGCNLNAGSTPPQTDLINLSTGGPAISTVHGFRTASSIAGQNGQNWYWATNSIPGGALVQGSFSFIVPNNAPAGPLSVTVCFTPSDAAGSKTCPSVVINIAAVRSPTVVGQNGDIYGGNHASVSGTCTQLGTTASVSTNAGSYGDYLISSSGTISTSPSSNGVGGGTTLKLGSGGSYAEICRPDLMAAYNSYGGVPNPITTPLNFDITDKTGVWVYNGGGPLVIHGTVTQPITVVATSPAAVVTFDQNVTVGAGILANARSLPSLGVISMGDIRITSAATQVDAYLFSSQGTIDTCYHTDNGASCNNVLTVNGFLMASGITFSRLGPNGSTGSQLAERITLTPQLYLNPPLFFDGIAANVTLNGQGEKQPLF